MQQRILVFSADTPRFGGCVGVGKSLRMRAAREAVTERRSMPRAVLTWMHRPSTVSQKRSRGRMVYGASHEERIRFRVKKKTKCGLLPFSQVPQQMSLVMLYRFDVDWSGLDTRKLKE